MKIPYFCCIGAELKRYSQDFDFMNQVYLYKVPTDDTIEEVLAQDYFQPVADTVLQDDIVYIYEPTTEMLYTCHFNKQNGHITAEQMSNNIPSLTPDKILISDATGHITAGDVSLDYIKNQLLAKVNIDGSSIMTGPLKFRAGSFSGAIAGGLGDGISIYKIKTDGTIDSEVASLTKTNGFTPGTTNAQNIGSPTLKWKDAYVARVITAVLNNGYDIAVPVTNGPDTLALKSQVDDAANSGEQLYTTGVWYAKMYAASTVPTGAEYDGKNYADFSQVDNDNNPIIVIYEGQSGSWVELTRITPPANHVGYITVTSKIWDIAEQTDQQGGEILWSYNQKTFTPYPKIVSVAGCANTNLSNLTTTGKANISKLGTYDPDTTYSAGTLGKAITDKVSKGYEVIAFQKPTAQNNYTWYRKYANGWVEQGGTTSNFTNTAVYTGENKVVSLPVAMANTKYDVQATLFSDISLGNGSISGYSYRVIMAQIDSTTQFTIDQYSNNLTDGTSICAKWYVCGMAAS